MYDLIVIGAGPAGYAASIRAKQLGAKVAVIERAKPGGTCVNLGCIPTKTLIESSKLLNRMKESGQFGIKADNIDYDFSKISNRKDAITQRLSRSVEGLIKGYKIDIFFGSAKFETKNKLTVTKNGEKSEVEGKKIIIATGSKPKIPKTFKCNGQTVLDSDQILSLKTPPKSICIIGGGAIGCEFAYILNSFGTKVTLVELLDRILPEADPDLALELQKSFSKKGISVKTGVKVKDISADSGTANVTIASNNEESIKAEKILIATGREADFEKTDISRIGIAIDSGSISVNEKLETNIDNIYAAGDVTGGMLLAYVATEEGVVAAENAMGRDSKVDYSSVPVCLYSEPEVASVGLSEETAKSKGLDINTGKFAFFANSKALISNKREGLVKLIADKNDTVLGVHIIGESATEIISEAALAVKKKVKARELTRILHAHPTLHENIHEAAMDANNKAIDMLPQKNKN